MSRTLLELRTIYKTYELEGKEIKVLNNINLDLEEHVSLAILGNIDSGKTSLIKIMAHYIEPSFGEVELFPFDKTQPALVNSVFHETSPFEVARKKLGPSTTVGEMIELIYDSRRNSSEKEELEKLIEASGLIKVNEEETIDKLSHSNYNKAKLISILANKPALAFFDDAISDLKYGNKMKFTKLMGEYIRKHKMTVVMTANDPEDVVHICDEYIVLAKGKIATFGNVEIPDGFVNFSESVSKWVEVGKVENHENVVTWFKNIFSSNRKILEERRLRDAAKNQLLLPGGEPVDVPNAKVIEASGKLNDDDIEDNIDNPNVAPSGRGSFLDRIRVREGRNEEAEEPQNDAPSGIETNNDERRSQMDSMKTMQSFTVKEGSTDEQKEYRKKIKEIGNDDESSKRSERAARLARIQAIEGKNSPSSNNPETANFANETPEQRLAKRKEMLERIKAREGGEATPDNTNDHKPESAEERLAKRKAMLERIKARENGEATPDNTNDHEAETPEQRLAKRKAMLERIKARENGEATPDDTNDHEAETPEQRLAKRKAMLERIKAKENGEATPDDTNDHEAETPEQRIANRKAMLQRIKDKEENPESSNEEIVSKEENESDAHKHLSPAEQRAIQRKQMLERIKEKQASIKAGQVEVSKKKEVLSAASMERRNRLAAIKAQQSKKSTIQLKLEKAKAKKEAEALAQNNANVNANSFATEQHVKEVDNVAQKPQLPKSPSAERAERLARIKAKENNLSPGTAITAEKPKLEKPVSPSPVVKSDAAIERAERLARIKAKQQSIANSTKIEHKPTTNTIGNSTDHSTKTHAPTATHAPTTHVPTTHVPTTHAPTTTNVHKAAKPVIVRKEKLVAEQSHNLDAKAAARKAMLERIKEREVTTTKSDVKTTNAKAMIDRIKAREGKLVIDENTKPKKPLSIERQKQNIERIAAMGKGKDDFKEIDHIKTERNRANRLAQAEIQRDQTIKSSRIQKENAGRAQVQHAEQLRIQMQELEQLKKKQLEIAEQKSEIQRLAQEAEMAKMRQINNSNIRNARISDEKSLLNQQALMQKVNFRAQEIEDRSKLELNRIEKEHSIKIGILQNRLDEEEKLRKIKEKEAQLSLESAVKQAELVSTRIANEKSLELKSTRESQLANQLLEIEKLVKQMEASSGSRNDELMKNAIEMKYKVLHQQELANRAARDATLANQKLARQERIAKDLRIQAERTRKYKVEAERKNSEHMNDTNVAGLNEIKLQKMRIEKMSNDISEIKDLIKESISSGDINAMNRINSLITNSSVNKNLSPSQIMVGHNPGGNYNLKPVSQYTPGAQATKVVGANGVVMSNVVRTAPHYKPMKNPMIVANRANSKQYLTGIDKQIWESEQRLMDLRLLKHREAESIVQQQMEDERQRIQAERLRLEEDEIINERKYLHQQQNSYLQNKHLTRYHDYGTSNASYYPQRKPMQYTAGDREKIQSNKSGDINAYEYGRLINQATPYKSTSKYQGSTQRVSQSAQRLSEAFREANRPLNYEDMENYRKKK